jgi:hypothetical protein
MRQISSSPGAERPIKTLLSPSGVLKKDIPSPPELIFSILQAKISPIDMKAASRQCKSNIRLKIRKCQYRIGAWMNNSFCRKIPNGSTVMMEGVFSSAAGYLRVLRRSLWLFFTLFMECPSMVSVTNGWLKPFAEQALRCGLRISGGTVRLRILP